MIIENCNIYLITINELYSITLYSIILENYGNLEYYYNTSSYVIKMEIRLVALLKLKY